MQANSNSPFIFKSVADTHRSALSVGEAHSALLPRKISTDIRDPVASVYDPKLQVAGIPLNSN